MCLLIVLAGTDPEFPLVVASNRDEALERAAVPITVLREARPRVLGGRDSLAGGTWLAVNDTGVVAGITNATASTERDPTRRSRGELPLFLATHRSAEVAVDAFVARYHPEDFNPAWLIAADRDAAFVIDMTGGTVPGIRRLDPGVHILENAPFGAPSPKVDRVRDLLGHPGCVGMEVSDCLRCVLTDHTTSNQAGPSRAGRRDRLAAVTAPCVHWDGYGTRWSAIVTVPRSPLQRPGLRYSDGPACTTEFSDAARLW